MPQGGSIDIPMPFQVAARPRWRDRYQKENLLMKYISRHEFY
jgi:hypothetical protein